MAKKAVAWSRILELKRTQTLPEVCLTYAEAVRDGDDYEARACLDVINLIVRLEGGWEVLVEKGVLASIRRKEVPSGSDQDDQARVLD
ncbi:hypothetical protein [Leucobacter sp. G161]|uniref:hypothetical protein n=1 Tax=Leucobacter sp. G161 TaxID=663704 RepID=UPI00073BC6BF|nr:hypothetical protein [Leucobacter sp. G161]KUF05551.1 hypothetical protein AUL38_04135 [Leucobacter sp. G161]